MIRYSTTLPEAGDPIGTTFGKMLQAINDLGGAGSVTSVGLVAPNAFVVSNSPVVSSGNLTLAWGSGQVPVANLGTGTADNTKFLRGDGTWQVVSAVAGSNTQVMFNDGGVLAGDAGLTYAKATDILSVAGAVRVGDGTLGAPSFSFSTQTSSGMFLSAADHWSLVSGGTSLVELYGPGFGNQIQVNGNLGQNAAADSTSPSSGSINTAGGLGVVKNLFVGIGANVPIVTGSVASGGTLTLRSTTHATKGRVILDEATASTSSVTGALTVAGGVGIVGNLYMGAPILLPAGSNSNCSIALASSPNSGILARGSSLDICVDGNTNCIFYGSTAGANEGLQVIKKFVVGPFGGGSIVLGAAGTLFTNLRHGAATLVAGTVTVNDTSITANTVIIVTRQNTAGTLGTSIDVTARSAGASFTLTANGSALDTSKVGYILIEP